MEDTTVGSLSAVEKCEYCKNGGGGDGGDEPDCFDTDDDVIAYGAGLNMRRGAITLVWATLSACSLASSGGGARPVAPERSLFETTLRALAEVARVEPLFVEPQPIRPGAALLSAMNEDMFAPQSDDEKQERVTLLRSLGYTPIDTKSLPGCAGSQIIENRERLHAGCPRSAQTIFLIGSTRVPNDLAGDTMTVVGLISWRGPGGSELREYEVVAARQGTRWHLVRAKPLMIVE